MALLTANITDLVTGTFPSIRKDTLTNLIMPLQKYYFREIFDANRIGFGGRQIQEELALDDNHSARHIPLNSQDVFNEVDAVQIITTTVRHTETSYLYDKRAIMAQGENAAKIYDYLKLKRVQAIGSLHALCESDFWGKPDTDASTLAPYGLFYSLVYSGTQGFNGANPTGFTAVYGLDTSTSSTISNIDRYRNYTANFSNITSADFLDTVWDAYMSVDFEPPTDIDQFRYGAGKRMQCYTTKANMRNIKHMFEGRNENLGYDLDKVDNTITFMGTPIRWAPALDSTKIARPINQSSNPFCMINWDCFKVRFLEGDYYRETGPEPLYGIRHNSIAVHIDLSWQTLNLDRRRMALIAQADPLS